MKTVKSNLICKPVVADSRSLIDGLSTVRMKKSLGLVLTVPIGVGMENSVIFIPDSGYSALQE